MGMADWWQIKYFGNIGIDGYGNPMGDGWNNLAKYGHEMNPFKWYPPEAPQAHINYNMVVLIHNMKMPFLLGTASAVQFQTPSQLSAQIGLCAG
jgi:hypothetical protein